MKERPILFSGPMVRAILDGRKTQTRRIVRLPAWFRDEYSTFGSSEIASEVACPYGAPGDRLWVREAWALEDLGEDGQRLVWMVDRAAKWVGDGETIHYLELDYEPARWRPSIHMPRWASRLTLEVTGVRVEQLRALETWNDRTEADVLAEGLTFVEDMPGAVMPKQYGLPGRMLSRTPWCAFQKLWDEINGKRAPWSSNPWVWVVEFRRIDPCFSMGPDSYSRGAPLKRPQAERYQASRGEGGAR